VYWLNFKPESDEALQAIAKMYTDETGVEVKVVTAASGTYNETLTAEMDKSEAPTMFVVGNSAAVDTWGEYCLDLTGTDIANELNTDAYMLRDADGKLCSIGYCYECYGIIVNKKLLKDAGYEISEITNFASLKAVAEDIHARAAELGFDAFSNPGLDGSSSWSFSGHLTNMPLYYEFRDDNVAGQPATVTGAYLDNFRNIWDLYVNTSAADPKTLSTSTGDESTGQFKEGKAVFYQNGTWEYAGLIEAGLKAEELTMIPLYCGVAGEENSGLPCGTENCWAINAKASQADIDATIAFVKWVVTSEEGTAMMAKEFGPIPFKNAKASENVFFNDANRYLAEGKYNVSWAFNHTPNVDSWRAGVVSALAAYSADPTDENWAGVEKAFVEGWAAEYAIQHG
jgi:raffinose/stachyose/melibiose transport system substrate-binding protein